MDLQYRLERGRGRGALKLTPLFLLAAIGIVMVDWSQVSFTIDDVPSWGALGASMVLVIFAYSGMETALIPSGEISDPARDVPRATLAAIALVVLLELGRPAIEGLPVQKNRA